MPAAELGAFDSTAADQVPADLFCAAAVAAEFSGTVDRMHSFSSVAPTRVLATIGENMN